MAGCASHRFRHGCHPPGLREDIAMTDDRLLTLANRLVAFRDARDWAQFHNPKDLAASISIEAAELQELFLWTSAQDVQRVRTNKRAEIEDELADVFISVLNFASHAGIDIIEAANRKIDKNEHKYPIERARGSALKYDEL